MSRLVRSIKNVTSGYSSSQVKVRNATCNDEYGPSTSELQEIAELTYSNHELFLIMDMVDKRLNDKGKNWRHVLKALVLLDHLVHYGSDNVIIWCRENLYIIKTLREFQHRDETGKDQGVAIRHRAKDLTALVTDSQRLQRVRAEAGRNGRSRRSNRRDDDYERAPRGPPPSNRPSRRNDNSAETDEDFLKALALSKESAEEDERRRNQMRSASQEDIQRAIELSRANGQDLFTNGSLIDTNEVFPQQQQQPLNTGYLQYSTTGMPYNDYDVQQYRLAQQQFQQQQSDLQRQYDEQQNQIHQLEQQLQATQTGIQSYEYQQQQEAQRAQAEARAQQDAQRAQAAARAQADARAQAEAQQQRQAYLQQQQQQAQQQLLQQQQQQQQQQAQPTGSNNPFAQERPGISRRGTFSEKHAELEAALTGGRETAADTFGNTGSQRIPAQHTRSTFVNSTGHGYDDRTSNNPFLPQHYTGIATTQMQPAYTGYGFGNAEASRSKNNLIDL